MSAIQQLLTDHIDIWTAAETEKRSGRGRASGNAGSVYGITKLRELILELAVRGKLVPQDANDEPASELLKRIQTEKAKLIAEGKIKKDKPLAAITEDEKPFELPNGWAWVRLPEVYFSISPSGSKLLSSAIKETGNFPVVDQGQRYIAGYTDEAALLINLPGPVIVFGDHTTERKYIDFDFVAGADGVKILRPILQDEHFFYRQLQSYHLEERGYARHFKVLNDNLYTLPPLAEQQRIVAKVDVLMGLCDQLENQHSNAAEAHEKLVGNLLGTLTQSQNAEDFSANWQRIAAHFDTLFTTEASIDALKQTLLQLAVMGKLVPQNINDEPAIELINRIAAKKRLLLNERTYQKTGNLNPKKNQYKYPENWVNVQIGEVCPSVVPSRDKPKSFSGGIPWITLPSFPSNGWYLDASKVELGLTIEEATDYSARVIPENSVLMSCIGRFGLTAINLVPVIPNQQIHAFIVLEGVVPEFLSMVIRISGKEMEKVATSTTIAYLNKSNCESIEFGMPPAAEQHRIVTKVDELMALCDQLKSRITDVSRLQQKMADVLVEKALV